MNENKILRKALDTYGIDAQIHQLHEEMAELTIAINKHKRGKDTVYHIAEEIADVMIMLEQMIIYYGISQPVQQWIKLKISRLGERLGINSDDMQHP